MSKRGTSFKLETSHVEILETRARELGIGKSEFLRNLIDSVHKVMLNSDTQDLLTETKNARISSFDEITVGIINALTREYDTTKNSKKPLNSIRSFAKKYDFKPAMVKGVLNRLVASGILIINKTELDKEKYRWTYLGITALPEYAPIDDNDENLISGSVIGALEGMLGQYGDLVNYLCEILKIDKKKADSLMRFFLNTYIGFFNWLREVVFLITGVNDELDNNYYRNQMTDYLLILIRNSEKNWKDWKTNENLDLKNIQKRILEHNIG